MNRIDREKGFLICFIWDEEEEEEESSSKVSTDVWEFERERASELPKRKWSRTLTVHLDPH